MKNTSAFIICLIIMLVTASNSFAYLHDKYEVKETEQTSNRLVVKFKPAFSPEGKTDYNSINLASVPGFHDLNKSFGTSKIEPLSKTVSQNENINPLSGIYVLHFSPGTDLISAAEKYQSLEQVEYAHPDYILELYDAPNDPYYILQWPLWNVGQGYLHVLRRDGSYNDTVIVMHGTPGADIDAHMVFDNPPDNAQTVIIAIIDTGVDIDHPDLIGRIWQNPGELPENGIDDDHNGFVDDIHGWDFTGNSSTLPVTGDNDPSDEFGHGTHCAGIAASVTNNLEGISGIVPDCRIMPIKFYPLMLSSYAARSIIYAADNGADIISMSFGYPWQVEILEDALNYARSKGVILCAATGNNSMEYFNYPGAYPQVISVGASTSDDEVAFFSTYGDFMDVVAPGYSILSLRGAGTDMYAPDEPNVHVLEDYYYIASGTSMSSPHVAGVLGYMLSLSPGLNHVKAQEIIQNTADDILDPFGEGLNLPGWDKYSGSGRINLADAISAVPNIRARINSPLPNQFVSGSIEVNGIADGSAFNGYILEYGSGDVPESWNVISESQIAVTDGYLGAFNTDSLDGRYTIRLMVGDDNIDRVTVNIVNSIQAELSSPAESDTVTSLTSIIGSASSPGFSHYHLEFKMAGDNQWQLIDESTSPIVNGLLGTWEAAALTEGSYLLRLSVFADSGILDSDSVYVFMKSILTANGNWKHSFSARTTIIPNYGDFDNDGENEIVVGTENGLYFFNPDGTQKTESVPDLPAYNFRMPAAVGDMNSDGIDDLVAVGWDGEVGRMYGFISDGTEFETAILDQPDVDIYNSDLVYIYPYICLKDMDNDGNDEILYYSNPNCWIYDIQGDLITQFTYFSGNPRHYLAADIDGNGTDEVYTSSRFLDQYDQQGNLVGSFDLQMNLGNQCVARSLSAVDIDNDDKLELVAFARFLEDGGNYWVYAFDENLSLKAGWPRNTGINSYLVPSAPVFADLNQDGQKEYFIGFFELVQAMVYAWDISGNYYLPGAASPLFGYTLNPGRIYYTIAANINGSSFPEVISNVKNDVYYSYNMERTTAWDYSGEILDGWPIYLRPTSIMPQNRGIGTPVVGDINNDGLVDIMMTTSLNELVFLNFYDTEYSPQNCPVPIWRYNRKLNNVCAVAGNILCGDIDGDNLIAINDAVRLVNYIFIPGSSLPVSLSSADTNCDDSISLVDIIWIINHIFRGGHEPCDLNGDGIPDC
ncbi:MAG: S8 family serine peptidase [candidate division Zixibacteria bacterium]|nr:S8 family serine peptidase [candidate division Zixibacteria bacterium]NIR66753.1 S8 family serine peptidase [candidate division Zixibacteria bacterium]NIS15102.1 S8 family serine peptidase [candidate division Zixibacteria bacterium]NIS48300.1 S8 family serine peptidase [candidate division Zixibacteria bacterium]NIU16416.1 S8 family serine peptidase [candidate division Zixibacteria bacterium]